MRAVTYLRRSLILASVLAVAATVFVTPLAWGQSEALSDQAKESFAPSPLSGFESTKEMPAYFSATIATNQYVTHQIDLRPVLTAYATDHQCTLNEAFVAIATKLQMIPWDPDAKDLKQLRNAIYRPLQNDVYQITARQAFFNDLLPNLYQIQHGGRQIVIEVSFASVPVMDIEVMQSFMIPDSFRASGNQLPQVVPDSTYATDQEIDQSQTARPPNGTFVLSSKTKTKSLPTFTGILDPKGIKQLQRFSRSRSNLDIVQAPTVTVFPGTRGTVTDAVMRPFVVSVKRIEHERGVSYQPVTQNVEDGTKMIFQAELKAGKIHLTGDLVFSEILDVETFDYPYASDRDGNKVTIQVPEHEVRKVHWSTQLDSGDTLFIDPVEAFEKEIKPKTRLKKAVTEPMRQIILVKTTLVDSPSDETTTESN